MMQPRPVLLLFLIISSCVALNTTNTTTSPSVPATLLPVTVAPSPPTPTAIPTPTASGPTLPACANRGSCSQCTQDNQCSWCSETSACVAQQSPFICSDRGWRTTVAQCSLPTFNPYLQQHPNEFGTLNSTNPVYTSNNVALQSIDPNLNFVYIQVDTITAGVPALNMQLLVRQGNSNAVLKYNPTVISATQSYFTIRPSVTGVVCDKAAGISGTTNKDGTRVCNFILQVLPLGNANNQTIDFKLSFANGPMLLNLDQPTAGWLSGPTVYLIGLEFPPSSLDVELTLRPNTTNPTTNIDLFVAFETSVNNPQFPDHTAGRGTNAEQNFLINKNNYQQGLFIVALVPAQIDYSLKYLEFFVTKNFQNTFVFGLSTLGIIAGIAILVLCIFSVVAVIAKRRRARAFLASQQASSAFVNQAAVPTGVTPEELELIPIHPFQKHAEASDDDSLCSICLSDYDVGQPVRTLACLHHFHTSCVDPWLKDHRTCPNCRKDAIQGLKGPSELAQAVERGVFEADASSRPITRSGSEPVSGPQIVVHSEREIRAISSPPTPISANVISPIQIDANFPNSVVTQTETSSPNDSSLSRSVRRLSHPRDLWNDTAAAAATTTTGPAPGGPRRVS